MIHSLSDTGLGWVSLLPLKWHVVSYGTHCCGGFDAGRTIKPHLACLLFFLFLPYSIHLWMGSSPSSLCLGVRTTSRRPSNFFDLVFTPYATTTAGSLKLLQNTTRTLESGVQFSDRPSFKFELARKLDGCAGCDKRRDSNDQRYMHIAR